MRGRFEFEVSLHQMPGLGAGPLRQVFDGMDVTRKLEFVEEHDLYRTVVPRGSRRPLPADWQGIVDAIEDAFPGNRARVETFLELTREVGNWQVVARADPNKPQEMTE